MDTETNDTRTTYEILNSGDYIHRDHPDATNWYVWKGYAYDTTPVYCRIIETPSRLFVEAQSSQNGEWHELFRDTQWLILETFRILENRDLFVAELISRLGLDREAIDREGLSVGNEILKALDGKLGRVKELQEQLGKSDYDYLKLHDQSKQENKRLRDSLAELLNAGSHLRIAIEPQAYIDARAKARKILEGS